MKKPKAGRDRGAGVTPVLPSHTGESLPAGKFEEVGR